MSRGRLNGAFRVALDATMLMALVGLAYWVGKQAQQIENMQKVGGVPISTEARERIGRLEARTDMHERQIRELRGSGDRNDR